VDAPALGNEKARKEQKLFHWLRWVGNKLDKWIDRGSGSQNKRRQNRKLIPAIGPNQKPEPCVHGNQCDHVGKWNEKGKTLFATHEFIAATCHNIKKSFWAGQNQRVGEWFGPFGSSFLCRVWIPRHLHQFDGCSALHCLSASLPHSFTESMVKATLDTQRINPWINLFF